MIYSRIFLTIVQLPSLTDSGVSAHFGAIALKLFGVDGVLGSPPYQMPKPNVRPFITRCMATLWHSEKQRIDREVDRVTETVKKADRMFAGKQSPLVYDRPLIWRQSYKNVEHQKTYGHGWRKSRRPWRY